MKRNILILSIFTVIAVLSGLMSAQAKSNVPEEVTLIKNVNIWDGKSDGLMEGYDVLIVRNLIKKVAKDIPSSGTYEVDMKGGNIKELSVHVGIDAYSINVIDEQGEIEKKEPEENISWTQYKYKSQSQSQSQQ